MSYVEKILSAEEEVVYLARISHVIYFPALLVMLLWFGLDAMKLDFSIGFASQMEKLKGWILIGFGAVAVFLLLRAYILQSSTELAITDRRIIAKFGFIARHSFEIGLPKVESIEVHQSLLGRIFNFGTLIVMGTGSIAVPIPYVRDPLSFQRAAGDRRIS